ncbi:MAG: hypothetical protein AUH43_19165 [Acidobacteria bacterium 13_1_40CM_65_14]|nr:MAG: hypothetical protein AUH43_19165 [Acidobacteria bacterium 13_1_40CM_65_14]
MMIPASTRVALSAETIRKMRARVAPGEMRTPISLVRRATAYAMTPYRPRHDINVATLPTTLAMSPSRPSRCRSAR